MAMTLGRPLDRKEHVDHKNQNKKDNRVENLQILTPSAHGRKTSKENMIEWKRLYDAAASMGYDVDEVIEILRQSTGLTL